MGCFFQIPARDVAEHCKTTDGFEPREGAVRQAPIHQPPGAWLSLTPQAPVIDLRVADPPGGVAGMLQVFGAYFGPGGSSFDHVVVPATQTAPPPMTAAPSETLGETGGVTVRLSSPDLSPARAVLLVLQVRPAGPVVLHAFLATEPLGGADLCEDGVAAVLAEAPGGPLDLDLRFLATGPAGARIHLARADVYLT